MSVQTAGTHDERGKLATSSSPSPISCHNLEIPPLPRRATSLVDCSRWRVVWTEEGQRGSNRYLFAIPRATLKCVGQWNADVITNPLQSPGHHKTAQNESLSQIHLTQLALSFLHFILFIQATRRLGSPL